MRHALAIVRQDGLDGLTIAGLAKRADAAVGGLYRYFPSKAHLIAALQVKAAQDMEAQMRARIEQLEAPELTGSEHTLATVMLAFGSWIEFYDEDPEAYALLNEALSTFQPILSDEAALMVQQEAIGPALRLGIEALQAAVAQGALRPGNAAVRARILWGTVHGLTHFRKQDRLLSDRSLHARSLWDQAQLALLAGWGADEAQVLHALAAVRRD